MLRHHKGRRKGESFVRVSTVGQVVGESPATCHGWRSYSKCFRCIVGIAMTDVLCFQHPRLLFASVIAVGNMYVKMRARVTFFSQGRGGGGSVMFLNRGGGVVWSGDSCQERLFD